MTDFSLKDIATGHIKSIQRGGKSLSGVSSGTTPITEVDLNKSFVISSSRPLGGASSPSIRHVAAVRLLNSTTLQFLRGTTTNSTTIQWEVVEHE